MKKILLPAAFLATFLLGFAFSSVWNPPGSPDDQWAVTGIGGIFFKSENPQKLKDWYHENLNFRTDKYGVVFEWHQGRDSTRKGFTQWSPFHEGTDYFQPSEKPFMINYRVKGMEAMVEDLRNAGVEVTDSIQAYSYGKFVHIMDPEGNKLELWEPDDEVYEAMGKELGSKTMK